MPGHKGVLAVQQNHHYPHLIYPHQLTVSKHGTWLLISLRLLLGMFEMVYNAISKDWEQIRYTDRKCYIYVYAYIHIERDTETYIDTFWSRLYCRPFSNHGCSRIKIYTYILKRRNYICIFSWLNLLLSNIALEVTFKCLVRNFYDKGGKNLYI